MPTLVTCQNLEQFQPQAFFLRRGGWAGLGMRPDHLEALRSQGWNPMLHTCKARPAPPLLALSLLFILQQGLTVSQAGLELVILLPQPPKQLR